MKCFKSYVAGLLTALLLCGLVVTAGAKTGTVTQELTYRDIRVSLDGKVLDLRNAIGEKVEPFMFDGTNYLPVRALAEALGLNVAWNGAEVMVVLTTPEPPKAETSAPESVIEPEAQPAAPTPETSNSGNLGKHHVTIKGARLIKDWNGNNAIVVTYQWTNNSDKTTSAMVSLMAKTFQNGVQLETALASDYNAENYMKDIRPGATLEVEQAFTLTSDTAPVEVEISELFSLSDDMVTMTFHPAELKSPA